MRLKISGIEVELLAHITTDHGTQVLQLLLAHELINYGHIFSGQTLVVLQKVIHIHCSVICSTRRLRRLTELWMHQHGCL